MTIFYKIELDLSWLEFNIGHLSDAAAGVICDDGEDFVETIENDTGHMPDEETVYPKHYLIKLGNDFKELAFKKKDLKEMKVSIGKRNIKIGMSNVTIVALERDEPNEKEYINGMGMVSIEQLAAQIEDSSVCSQIRNIYCEHVARRHQLWQRSKLEGSIFINADHGAGYCEAEGDAEGDIQSDDVKFIFFAASPILFNGDQIEVEDEKVFFPTAGLYLAAIIIQNKLIDFYFDTLKGNAVYRYIVTYAHDQTARLVFSE